MASNLIVCGGTFDHFHKGHEAFLSYALSLCGKLVVGLTSDDYVRQSKIKNQNFPLRQGFVGQAKLIEDYEIRKRSLEEFLTLKKIQDRVSILKIDDLFGPTLAKDLSIDGIVVSEDTEKGADIINQKRRGLGLIQLKVFVAPSVMAEDGILISSARIRDGEINRAGRLSINPLWFNKNLVLPEDLRQEFAKPFSEIVEDFRRNDDFCIVTVGDATTKNFNENFIKQNISIVDFKIARKEEFYSFSELGFQGNEDVIMVNNPAGHITFDLFRAIAKIFKADFKNRIILKVIGEEDLAVLPIVLAAPLGVDIYYGQPDEGLVKVVVSEEAKNKAYNLLLKLEQA